MDNDNGWISVKDKLPDASKKINSERYLILMKGNHYGISPYMKGFKSIQDECKLDGFRYYDNFGLVHNFIHVTHWMPLPKPPKTSDK